MNFIFESFVENELNMTAIKFYTKKYKSNFFGVWNRIKSDHINWSICRFFGGRVADVWTMSYRFFIKKRPKNYLKVTDI
jgi:hypothetical protein